MLKSIKAKAEKALSGAAKLVYRKATEARKKVAKIRALKITPNKSNVMEFTRLADSAIKSLEKVSGFKQSPVPYPGFMDLASSFYEVFFKGPFSIIHKKKGEVEDDLRNKLINARAMCDGSRRLHGDKARALSKEDVMKLEESMKEEYICFKKRVRRLTQRLKLIHDKYKVSKDYNEFISKFSKKGDMKDYRYLESRARLDVAEVFGEAGEYLNEDCCDSEYKGFQDALKERLQELA